MLNINKQTYSVLKQFVRGTDCCTVTCDILTDGGNDDHSANNEESEPEFTNKCGML